MKTAGRLSYADIWLNQPCADEFLAQRLKLALQKHGIAIVGYTEHKFEPQGLTAIWILAESHCALHTYPEHQYCSVDIYTCGEEGIGAEVLQDFSASLPGAGGMVRTVGRGADARATQSAA